MWRHLNGQGNKQAAEQLLPQIGQHAAEIRTTTVNLPGVPPGMLDWSHCSTWQLTMAGWILSLI